MRSPYGGGVSSISSTPPASLRSSSSSAAPTLSPNMPSSPRPFYPQEPSPSHLAPPPSTHSTPERLAVNDSSTPRPSISPEHSPRPYVEKDKKKGLFRNPFGWKKDKSREDLSDIALGSASDGDILSRGYAPVNSSLSGSDPVLSMSSRPPLSPKPKKKTEKLKDILGLTEEQAVELDLSGFSMDPSFVPYDVVNLNTPPASQSASSSSIPGPSAPLTPHIPSPYRTPGTPLPTPSLVTSTWTPPESWAVRFDAPDPTTADSLGVMPATPGGILGGGGGTLSNGRAESLSSKSVSTDHASVRSVPLTPGGPTGSGYDMRVVHDDMATDEERRWQMDKMKEDRVGCLRLFRRDSTFATISARESATTQEILQIMSRKSLIPDYTKFTICLVRHGQERILARMERPLLLQRRLLEEIGYEAGDRIEMLGREDNSYLLKFIFKEISTGNEIDPNYWKSPNFDPRYISFSGFNLSTIPVSLFRLAGDVVHLDLSGNLNIQDLPNDLAQSLHQLRSVTLADNGIPRFPKSLRLIETLTDLNLSHNRIGTLEGSGIGSLPNLVKLNLSSNLLDRIPEDVPRGSQNLQTLLLSNNRFTSFPADLCRYLGGSLRHLDLSFCRIKGRLPDAIGQLRRLETLRLVGNRMYGGVPWPVGELQELREVDFRGNSIGNISGDESVVMEVLCRCGKLEAIRLDGNRVRWVGKWSDREGVGSPARRVDAEDEDGDGGGERMLDAPSLKYLTLGSQFDPTKDRPMVFRLSNVAGTLVELDVSYCGLDSLPAKVFQRMSGLMVLNVSGNRLKELPPFTGSGASGGGDRRENGSKPTRGVFQLRELYASNNFLEFLPEDIGELEELTAIEVQSNHLRELPLDIWRCRKLKVLNASSNMLERFPPPYTEEDKRSGGGGALGIAGPGGNVGVVAVTDASGVMTFARSGPSRSTNASDWSPQQQPTSPQQQQLQPQQSLPPLSYSLEHLYLADNHLDDSFYITLYHLPNLTSLHTSFNDITDITPWVVAIPPAVSTPTPWFTRLRELHLSGNAIASLPGEVERMRGLKALFLNGNKL
ncbi:cysteinyl-tRNA synthetase, partial [Borealophlyctis nickersoniae]